MLTNVDEENVLHIAVQSGYEDKEISEVAEKLLSFRYSFSQHFRYSVTSCAWTDYCSALVQTCLSELGVYQSGTQFKDSILVKSG